MVFLSIALLTAKLISPPQQQAKETPVDSISDQQLFS